MTDAAPTVALVWNAMNSVFVPAGRHSEAAAHKHYKDGERYLMREVKERSSASHNHFFSVTQNAHDSLPDRWLKLLPTPEHLRHYCLIKAGFADSQTYPCDSEKEAVRLMRALKPLDEFSLVTREGTVVTRHVAKSQSAKAMGRDEFEQSKQKCIEIMAHMIGVTPHDLARTS